MKGLELTDEELGFVNLLLDAYDDSIREKVMYHKEQIDHHRQQLEELEQANEYAESLARKTGRN